MKFLRIPGLDQLNLALTFDAHDCRVVGGVDIYATKATGADKKVYKTLMKNIVSRAEADLRTSQSLSPPTSPDELSSTKVALLSSPFGPLNENGAVRTFAYLLDTLNASHPDYDFYGVIRPWDFQKTRVQRAMSEIDTSLFNLGHAQIPGFWERIDKEMDLAKCKCWSYRPEDDPFSEEGALWGQSYFFFNKTKKRVCYVYLRSYALHDGKVAGEDGETLSVWGDMDDDDLDYPMEDDELREP